MHIEFEIDKQVNTTNQDIFRTNIHDASVLVPCSHKEAVTLLFVHADYAVNKGWLRIMICSIDTDVVIIAVSIISIISVSELSVAFDTGRHLWYISIWPITLSLVTVK